MTIEDHESEDGHHMSELEFLHKGSDEGEASTPVEIPGLEGS